MNAKAEILKAADQLFAEVGFDAATTREIAELSGVNKALIHYHFKSKEALFEALLDRYYQELNQTLLQAMNRPGDIRERLFALVDVYLDFLSANRNFSRMVQRESAGGKHLDRVVRNLTPMFKAGAEWIQAAYPQTAGGDFSAVQLLVSFYGMIVSYFTYGGALGQLTGEDVFSAEAIGRRRRHLHRMLELTLSALDGGRKPEAE